MRSLIKQKTNSLAKTLNRHARALGLEGTLSVDDEDSCAVTLTNCWDEPGKLEVTVHQRRPGEVIILCHSTLRFPLDRFPRLVTDLVELRNEELEDFRWIDSEINGRSYLLAATKCTNEEYASVWFADVFKQMVIETVAVDKFLTQNGYGI